MPPNWLEKLVGETRVRILVLLRHTQRSITDLAGELGLTDNAVRTHVAALGRDGLVEAAGTLRDTGGKPARLYRLTPGAEELFPKAYSLVLGSVVEELVRVEGSERAEAFLRGVGRRLAGGRREGESAARIDGAALALRSLGGDVEVEPVDGGWVLQGRACPLSGVTARHAEVCSLAAALVEEITGLPTTECCTRGERPRCGFRIEEES